MSPRILEVTSCPHCKERLAPPNPRACPSCGGSLQVRYLRWGCLSSAPLVVALVALVWAASRTA